MRPTPSASGSRTVTPTPGERHAVVAGAAARLGHAVRRDRRDRLVAQPVEQRGRRARTAEQHHLVGAQRGEPVGVVEQPRGLRRHDRGARGQRRVEPPGGVGELRRVERRRAADRASAPPGRTCPTSERISTCSPPTPVTGSASSHAAGAAESGRAPRAPTASSADAGSSTPRGAPVDPLVASTTATSASTASRDRAGRPRGRGRRTRSSPAGAIPSAGPSPASAAGSASSTAATPAASRAPPRAAAPVRRSARSRP